MLKRAQATPTLREIGAGADLQPPEFVLHPLLIGISGATKLSASNVDRPCCGGKDGGDRTRVRFHVRNVDTNVGTMSDALTSAAMNAHRQPRQKNV